MGVVRVLPKGQITMPKAVRERLGIEVGDDLLVEVVGEREARVIVLPRPTSLKDLRRLVKPRRPPGRGEGSTGHPRGAPGTGRAVASVPPTTG